MSLMYTLQLNPKSCCAVQTRAHFLVIVRPRKPCWPKMKQASTPALQTMAPTLGARPKQRYGLVVLHCETTP